MYVYEYMYVCTIYVCIYVCIYITEVLPLCGPRGKLKYSSKNTHTSTYVNEICSVPYELWQIWCLDLNIVYNMFVKELKYFFFCTHVL